MAHKAPFFVYLSKLLLVLKHKSPFKSHVVFSLFFPLAHLFFYFIVPPFLCQIFWSLSATAYSSSPLTLTQKLWLKGSLRRVTNYFSAINLEAVFLFFFLLEVQEEQERKNCQPNWQNASTSWLQSSCI